MPLNGRRISSVPWPEVTAQTVVAQEDPRLVARVRGVLCHVRSTA